MTVAIRLKAMAMTFSWTVLTVIVKPIVDLLFKQPLNPNFAIELFMPVCLNFEKCVCNMNIAIIW